MGLTKVGAVFFNLIKKVNKISQYPSGQFSHVPSDPVTVENDLPSYFFYKGKLAILLTFIKLPERKPGANLDS
ncbi:hypothetical protein [Endozoicomonas ascidiicola]|uniref:hypothetical protein n=1 Tax=Endozoicomonas ascidiicola TaxID=1698521 RepID=UPI000A5CE3FC|nr:hypothetical protein [Endozoicomonas ascidiicola]